MSVDSYFEERILKALSLVENNRGLTTERIDPIVGFVPLFALQQLHQLGQVEAAQNGRILPKATVAKFTDWDSTHDIIWRLTPAGRARANQLGKGSSWESKPWFVFWRRWI